MFKRIFGFGLVALMLLACFAGIASAEVNYAKTYTDPSGDVLMNQNDDIDALEVRSTQNGDHVLVTIKFVGTALTNISYSIELNVDGEEASLACAYGITVYTKGDTYAFPNMTASGDTITFKVAKSDLNATTSFDIVSAAIVDYDFNMDSVEGGEAPSDDDDDDDTTDDDIISDDDDDDNATDDDTNETGGEKKKNTPGFELLFVMAAAAVVGVVFWIRRK